MSDAAAISEAASEKRRPGRPALYGKDERRSYDCLWHVGPRELENVIRMQDALRTLFPIAKDMFTDLRFRWLFDPNGKVKVSILSELGRLPADDRVPFALSLCESKPTTKEAVARLRRYRLGRKNGDVLALVIAVCRAVDAYRSRFELSTDETVRALQLAAEAVTDTDAEATP